MANGTAQIRFAAAAGAGDQQVLSSFQPVGLGQLRHLGLLEIASVLVVDVLNRSPELEASLANQAILFPVLPGLELPVQQQLQAFGERQVVVGARLVLLVFQGGSHAAQFQVFQSCQGLCRAHE